MREKKTSEACILTKPHVLGSKTLVGKTTTLNFHNNCETKSNEKIDLAHQNSCR